MAHIVQAAERFEVNAAIEDLAAECMDVCSLAKRHAEALEGIDPGSVDRRLIDGSQRLPHPAPNGGLCRHGDLLPHDVAHHRGEEIVVSPSLDGSEVGDDAPKDWVGLAQIGHFGFGAADEAISFPHG